MTSMRLNSSGSSGCTSNGHKSSPTSSSPKVPTIPAPISTSLPRHYVSIHIIYTILIHHSSHYTLHTRDQIVNPSFVNIDLLTVYTS